MKLKTLIASACLSLVSLLPCSANNDYGIFQIINKNETDAPIILENKKVRIKPGEEHIEKYNYLQFHKLAQSFLTKWKNAQAEPEDIEIFPTTFNLVTEKFILEMSIKLECDSSAEDCDFNHIHDSHIKSADTCEAYCTGTITRTFKKRR